MHHRWNHGLEWRAQAHISTGWRARSCRSLLLLLQLLLRRRLLLLLLLLLLL